MKTQYPDYKECERRYPRLVRCMQFVAILSEGEASCALRDWKRRHAYGGEPLGGEAVSHFGGCRVTIERAIACRNTIRKLDGGRFRPLYPWLKETSDEAA